jgi:hypothetical protein
MKQRSQPIWKILIILAGLQIAALVCAPMLPKAETQPAGAPGYDAIEAKILEALQQVDGFDPGKSLAIYELEVPTATKVASLASGPGVQVLSRMGGGTLDAQGMQKFDDLMVGTSDKGWSMKAFSNSGFLSVANMDAVYSGKTQALGNAQVAQVAQKFAQGNGLLTLQSNETLALDRVRNAFTHLTRSGGPVGQPILNNQIAVLARQVGGVPTFGPGGKFVAFLSGRSRVMGFHMRMRNLTGKTSGQTRSLPLDQIAASLTADLNERFGDSPPSASSLQINRVEYGYFEAGPHQLQKFLQPAYAIQWEVKNSNAPNVAGASIVPAGDTLLEPLNTPPRITATPVNRATAPAASGPKDD